MIKPLSNNEAQILVRVLDKQYDLAEFTLDLVPDFMQDVQKGGILDPLGQLINWLWSMIEDAIAWVVNTLKPLFDLLKNAVISGLTLIVNTGTDLLKGLVNGVTGIVNGIVSSVGSIWNLLNGVWIWLNSMWTSLSGILATIGSSIASFFGSIIKSFSDLGNWIASLVAEGMKGFQDLWAGVQKYFTDAYNNLVIGFNSVVMTLQGGINALGQIWNWLTNLPKMIWDAAVGVFDTIVSALTTLGSVVWTGITTITGWIFSGLQAIGTVVWEGLLNVGSFLINLVGTAITTVLKIGESVVSAVRGSIEGLISNVLMQTGKTSSSFMSGLISRVKAGSSAGEYAELGLFAGTIFASQLGFTLTAFGVDALGYYLNDIDIAPTLHLEPLGLGVDTRIALKVKLGDILHEISTILLKFPDMIASSMIGGVGFWLGRAYSKVFVSPLRNTLPLELPPLPTLVDITRRNIPTGKLKPFTDTMTKTLSLYGFNDEVIKWQTSTVEAWNISVKDRFGDKRLVPVSLLYDIPTGSEMCRMMVRDVFGSYDEFKKVISMRGFNEDVAWMYYLLHFKYPSPETLWRFQRRAGAGLLWKVKATEEDIKDVMPSYMKWHDYFYESWFKDKKKFPADRDIMVEMAADLPTRIDARWMYKWSIIKDEDLENIVIASGIIPDYVKNVATAEALNALSEERTFARSGVLAVFKEGFASKDTVTKTLTKLATVKVLGKDIDIKFIVGEIELLSIRARYDRAIDILRDYSRDLIRAYSDNVVAWSEVTTYLSESTSKVAIGLGLDLDFDESYFELYEPVAAIVQNVSTVRRVRSWIRYMMWRILTRMSSGYLSEEEFSEFIDTIVAKGRLAPEERDILEETGTLMLNFTKRQTIVSSILKKLSKGMITSKDALAELISNGMDQETAQAMIENQAKTYVMSISTLLAYSDDVQIPTDMVAEKLGLMGVPPDEVPILLEVFRIRPIKTELAQVIRATINDYGDGYITEPALRERLVLLGRKPAEIELLVEYGNMQKQATKNKLLVDSSLSKLRRGAITVSQCSTEIAKYIADVSLVEALIEKNTKTYVASISTLQSMNEVIPISTELIQKKMDMIGVPADEQKLYLPYLKVKEIESELKAYFTQVGTDYINGVLTKVQFTAELGNIATLWGTSKKTLGVDWVVYSPEERALLIMIYDKRRARKVK